MQWYVDREIHNSSPRMPAVNRVPMPAPMMIHTTPVSAVLRRRRAAYVICSPRLPPVRRRGAESDQGARAAQWLPRVPTRCGMHGGSVRLIRVFRAVMCCSRILRARRQRPGGSAKRRVFVEKPPL